MGSVNVFESYNPSLADAETQRPAKAGQWTRRIFRAIYRAVMQSGAGDADTFGETLEWYRRNCKDCTYVCRRSWKRHSAFLMHSAYMHKARSHEACRACVDRTGGRQVAGSVDNGHDRRAA